MPKRMTGGQQSQRVGSGYKQTYADAQRKQAIADALAGRSITPTQRPQQGRIAANTGLADGLTALMSALVSRRIGKQATALTTQGDEERRKAQAAALGGFANPPNMVETPEAQSPYGRAQRALEADVDPKVVGSYLETKLPGASKSPFGVVNPSDFTPDSLRKFAQSKDMGDLVPVANDLFGRYNPRDYTPESLAKFQQTKDPGDLRRVANYQPQQLPGGGIGGFNPVSGGIDTTPVTNQDAQAQAADLARQKAAGSAAGEASGKAEGAILSKATNAEGVKQILDIADPLIDAATGSSTGAARDKLAAFFGQATEGANAIAQLRVLQAGLMLGMPRMEGPQSDRDVNLYREAAGQIGDQKIPGPTKKAAMQTIRALQDKYVERAGGAPAATPKRVKVDANGDVIGN